MRDEAATNAGVDIARLRIQSRLSDKSALLLMSTKIVTVDMLERYGRSPADIYESTVTVAVVSGTGRVACQT
jgi:hypothetical protein